MDLYSALEIDRGATEPEVRKAYRQAAKRHHPDCGGSAEDFARIVLAHSVLTDPDRRKQYDETGAVDPLDAAVAQMAFDGLIMAASALVEMGINPALTNLVAEAANLLSEQLKAIRAAERRSVRGMRALAALKTRFRRRPTNDGDLDLGAMIATGEARRKAYYETQVKIVEGAVAALKGWEFEREPLTRSMSTGAW